MATFPPEKSCRVGIHVAHKIFRSVNCHIKQPNPWGGGEGYFCIQLLTTCTNCIGFSSLPSLKPWNSWMLPWGMMLIEVKFNCHRQV